MRKPPPDVVLACEDPEECVNGPQPHEFIPGDEYDLLLDLVFPCFRQSWETGDGDRRH